MPWLVGPIAAIPGAVLLAGANDGLDAGWVPIVIVVGTVVIGATAADLDRRTARFGLGPLLLFITVAGIYVTVPDTELMRAVVGVAMPLVLLRLAVRRRGARLRRRVRGGRDAAVDHPDRRDRPRGAIVGVVGAFALLVGEPLGRVLARSSSAGSAAA